MRRSIGLYGFLAAHAFFCINALQQSMSLRHLEISEEVDDESATDEFPSRQTYVFNFYGGDEVLLMRCAGIDIEVYSLQTYEDERKLISVFGAASKPLFNTGAHQSAVYLSRFEICDDKHKNQGLGKQLFLYGLIKMKQLYPKSSYFWIAEPLDGQDKKESLFRFYKSCGATMIKNYGTTALFYIDLAKLDLGLFKPEREPSEYLSVRSRL